MTHITHNPDKSITVTVGEASTTLNYNPHGRHWEIDGRKWTHWPHAVDFVEKQLKKPVAPTPRETNGPKFTLIPTPRGAARARRGA